MTAPNNLRKSAKRWLKALRANEPGARARLERAYPNAPVEPALRDVQHALARERGYESWTAMTAAAERRTAPEIDLGATGGATHEERVSTFLQFACWDHHVHGEGDHRMYDRAAGRLLRSHPEIGRNSIYTAIVSGDVEEVERIVAARPEAAREAGGARGWTPILYLSFTRFTHQPAIDNAVAIGRALLDRGANPNDFYPAGGAGYTALVGVAGGGEQDSPRQPQSEALFQLLLERGAEPFDHQVLYNTHFRGDILWWLELVYAHTTKTGRLAAWDDPDWPMLDMGGYGSGARFLLWTALKTRNLRLAEWVLSHGASPEPGPASAPGFPKGSVYEEAIRRGFPEMGDLLVRHGARPGPIELDERGQFMDACFRLDRRQAAALAARQPELLRSTEVLFAAAEADRADVMSLLLDLGVPIEVEGASKQRALHVAAGANALLAAALLIERGAEVDPRETKYNGTPLQGAAHYWHEPMLALLSRHSRDVWYLAFTGSVDRLREVLHAEPALASVTAEDGTTPLWWLPHDETKALQIVDLLLAHGADASRRSQQGKTAADWALKMGMRSVAARLAAAVLLEPSSEAPDVRRYEQLAEDLVRAFDADDAAALQRISEHYKRTVSGDDVRANVWQAVESVRKAGGRAGSFPVGTAREFVARESGFGNWDAFATARAAGTPPPPAYLIDARHNRIGPRRALDARDWEEIVSVMTERRIAALDAGGQITDAALERLSQLDHVTRLGLGGSRQITDAGLWHLARMPQLEELDLSHYPGGLITDRGLEVLRHLPRLKKFQVCWQPGISDTGVANLAFCDLLEEVNLLGTPTGDGAIRALTGKRALRRFVTGRQVTDAGLPLLHEFPAFKKWPGGDVGYSLMGVDAAPTHLSLDGPFTNAGLASIAGLEGVFGLSLFWHVAALTPEGLAPLVHLPNLGLLGCEGSLCDDTAMRYIAAMPRLKKLMAQGTVADDEGFAALSRSPTIEYIWGRECSNLTGRGFASMAAMPSLRGLAVSCKNVDDSALSTLPRFPSLTELMPMDVPDAGFRHVGRCAQLQRLWCMYCRDTTDAATAHIAGLPLVTYYAGATQITDRSLEILSSIQTLEKIELYECSGITDAGLALLARLPKLREVGLDGVPYITLAGTAAFPARVRVNYSV